MNEREAEIKKRVDAATKGPWFAELKRSGNHPEVEYFDVVSDNGDYRTFFEGTWLEEPDAKFIAHSREDVPYLLGRVERLEAALRRINSGRHGELNAVEMAVIAYAALADEEGKRES